MQGYDSFLLRRWRLKDGTYRIAVEHVQSGERIVAVTLDAALVWISVRSDDPEDGVTDGTARTRRGWTPAVGNRGPP